MNLDLGYTRKIIEYARSKGILRNQLAYILATAYHETAFTMKPVRETKADTDSSAIARLDNAFAKGQLPWVKTKYWTPDSNGRSYFGRGFVQLTWKDNYKKAEDKLGLPFVVSPSLALDPDHATKILVEGMLEGWFTGKKLSDYITLQKSDFLNARRIVNGTDRAKEIAAYAEKYDDLLLSEAYGIYEVEDPDPQDQLPPPTPSFFQSLFDLFKRLFN